jgi:hypothetical protein
MGCDFVWVCDRRKEYMDPYPLSEWHLFTYCNWGPWRDEQVRLINDCGGSNWEYYERTHRDAEEAIACGDSPNRIYRDVTDEAKKLHAEMYPPNEGE